MKAKNLRNLAFVLDCAVGLLIFGSLWVVYDSFITNRRKFAVSVANEFFQPHFFFFLGSRAFDLTAFQVADVRRREKGATAESECSVTRGLLRRQSTVRTRVWRRPASVRPLS